jgi:hypothetical protein
MAASMMGLPAVLVVDGNERHATATAVATIKTRRGNTPTRAGFFP